MSDPKMKTTLYASKLKARLSTLQTLRKKALKQFEKDVELWRKKLAIWVRENASSKVAAIKVAELRNKYRRSDQAGFDIHAFFVGAPEAPRYPDDKVIRDIQRKIQYLAIIHLKEVYVPESEVATFFGPKDDDED